MDAALAYRREAARLPPSEAVDYLLCVIEELVSRDRCEWSIASVSLTASQRRIFRAIASGHGAIVSRDAVYAQLVAGRPECDWPEDRSLSVYVHNLRGRLRGTPYAIETVWGQGWRMVAPVGTIWPWEVAQ